MDARPRGPAAKRQPGRAGVVGTAPYVLFCAKPLSTHMSHSYSNACVHVVYSTKDRKDLISTKFEKRLYSFIASIARGHKKAGVPYDPKYLMG
jgi:hypothetical protein